MWPPGTLMPATERIAHYRELAVQYRKWAESETNEAARAGLLDMARQYDRLAGETDLKDLTARSQRC